MNGDFEDAMGDLQKAHEDALQKEFDRGSDAGYKDGYNDGQRDGDQALNAWRAWFREELTQRRLRAELPLPLNGIIMTLEEIEELIKEA